MNQPNGPQVAGAVSRVLLSEQEAAKYLNLSKSFLRKRRIKGLPPEFIKIGKSIRYSLETLDVFVAEQTRRRTK